MKVGDLKPMKMMSKKLNITLNEIKPRMDWALKEWEVYSGPFYLGRIYKRYIGKGTPLRDGKKKHKVYQCSILLYSGENLGMPFGSGYPETLIEAKDKFRLACKKLIKNLNPEN